MTVAHLFRALGSTAAAPTGHGFPWSEFLGDLGASAVAIGAIVTLVAKIWDAHSSGVTLKQHVKNRRREKTTSILTPPADGPDPGAERWGAFDRWKVSVDADLVQIRTDLGRLSIESTSHKERIADIFEYRRDLRRWRDTIDRWREVVDRTLGILIGRRPAVRDDEDDDR